MPKKSFAVIYSRYSPGPKERSVSITMQRKHCLLYCGAYKYEVIGFLEDRGVSGKSRKNRHGLRDALALAKEYKATLVVYTIDRLARDTMGTLEIWEELRSAGASFASVQEKLDLSSPMGKMMGTVLAGMAQMNREIGVQRTRDALQTLRDNGFITGHIAYGWKRHRTNPKKQVINQQERKVMQFIKEIYLDGSGCRRISNILYALGVHSRTGPAWDTKAIWRILQKMGVRMRPRIKKKKKRRKKA